MKTKLYLITALVILIICAGCGNPFFPVAYKVGDTGPGDGIIFYDKGRFTDGWRYLEASPVDVGDHAWAPNSSFAYDFVSGATGTAIGTGRANTRAIIAIVGNAYPASECPAAWACVDYRGGGKSDWFLPSRDELNELYKQRGFIGGLSGTSYWSSSQDNADAGDAWNQDFDNSLQYPTIKTGYLYVRPIRAF